MPSPPPPLTRSALAEALPPQPINPPLLAHTNTHTHCRRDLSVHVDHIFISHPHVVCSAFFYMVSSSFPHTRQQQPGAHTAPCCVTCLTGETKRSGTEASICAWLITHPPPHPPHSIHGCTCSGLAANSTPVGTSPTTVVKSLSSSPFLFSGLVSFSKL